MPSPALFFETLNAYHRTEVLKTAIELDVFTAIGEGHSTAGSIGAARGADPRGMRILCDYLVLCGFLTKSGETYALTEDSAVFLDRRSPAYVGGATAFLAHPAFTENYKQLPAAVRKGGTAHFDTVSIDNPIWVQFAHGMAPLMAPVAGFISELSGADKGPVRVLDIAAGHGLFGITVLQRNPEATAVALDWATVLEVAAQNAHARGVADRWKSTTGNAFEVDFGSGYTHILLTNFLHHFPVDACEKLLKKVHAALAPGGKVATLEFIPNEDRVSPPMHASFALIMLAGTEGGDAYTFSEYDRMFKNAGFSKNTLHEIEMTGSRIIVSEA